MSLNVKKGKFAMSDELREKLVQFDEEIEQLMSQLGTKKLTRLSQVQQGIWEEIFQNVNICNQWLKLIESGNGSEEWITQIEEGLKMARADLQSHLA